MLTLLAACYVQVHTSECTTETLEVEDADLVGDLTVSAGEVLDVVEGTFPFEAAYEGGGAVTGEFTVVRGEGPALVTDGTLVEHVSRGEPGFGDWHLTVDVPCEDTLEVPVEVSFGTDDGAVLLTTEALAFPLSTRVDHAPELFEVSGDVDPEAVEAMPAPSEPDAVAGFGLQWTPDAALSSVSLWWSGGSYEQVLETE